MTAKRTRKPSPAVLEARAYYKFVLTFTDRLFALAYAERDTQGCFAMSTTRFTLREMAHNRTIEAIRAR